MFLSSKETCFSRFEANMNTKYAIDMKKDFPTKLANYVRSSVSVIAAVSNAWSSKAASNSKIER